MLVEERASGRAGFDQPALRVVVKPDGHAFAFRSSIGIDGRGHVGHGVGHGVHHPVVAGGGGLPVQGQRLFVVVFHAKEVVFAIAQACIVDAGHRAL